MKRISDSVSDDIAGRVLFSKYSIFFNNTPTVTFLVLKVVYKKEFDSTTYK